MKSKLPKLTSAALLVTLALSGSAWAQPEPHAPEGQQLLLQAAHNLAQHPSLEVKLRQRVALFGQYLVGSGSYRQLIIGQRKRLRLELKLQVGDQTTSLLQISDGTTLWERRDVGSTQSLTYVNLRRVREALGPQPAVTTQTPWVALGGIDFLLRGLRDSFDFEQPMPQQMSGLPVWEIRGRWKPEKLAALAPAGEGGEAPKPADLPEHLPHSVVITLGRDELLPLFPYRIEFRRQIETGEKTGQVGVAERPLATIELFEVQHYQVDPRDFEFPLNDQQIEDRTEQYLQQLRGRM